MRHELLWGTGPNSAGGHASVVFNEEVQVRGVTWGFKTLGFFVGGAVPERARRVQIQHTMRLVKPIFEGRGTVIRGPRRSERKVQFVDAEMARSDGVEPLPIVLSPRRHNGQNFRDVFRGM